jgi:hypothetical protein
MNRRSFIKNAIAGSSGMFVSPMLLKASRLLARGAAGGEAPSFTQLEMGFRQPPPAARPYTYWMWMNGNITRKGITLDLETMRQSGVGGALIYNDAVGIPRGPVDFATDGWFDMVVHAAREAARLGLDLSMHNAPGYSGCGGPWITPEMSMQQLEWTESLVTGGQHIELRLPQPYAKRGYYRDAVFLAFPTLAVESALMRDRLMRVTLNGTEVDRQILIDRNPETKVRLENSASALVLEFSEPFEARAVTVIRTAEEPKNPFDGPKDYPPTLQLDASDNGNDFYPVCSVAMPALRQMNAPGAQSFPAARARFFRITSKMPTWISEVDLHAGPRLQDWPVKTHYAGTRGAPRSQTEPVAPEFVIDPQTVIDVGAHVSEGTLRWEAPSGRWIVLRLGSTTTGENVAAAPESGIGLECDKFSKDAVDFHFRAFIDPLLAKLGPLAGKSFTGLTIDSWEAGKQNWTRNFPAEFKQRRQYEITRYAPALTGRIVGSVDDTERFLWDVRQTHADLLAENFYGRFRELCHARGLMLGGEPYGDGTFDSLQVGATLDLPMSEFWAHDPRDNRAAMAAALAHGWGRRFAVSEAFTGAPSNTRWTEAPYGLKADGDWIYTTGVNRLVFHTMVHQPYTTGLPGMTMGPFGTHFDRNSTWSRQAYGWVGYLTRAQNLLQQGLAVVDVCYFEGENLRADAPDARTDGRALFPGYAVDRVDRSCILERFAIRDGRIVLPDGMSYRLLVLPEMTSISARLLRRIADLVADGMTLLVQSRPDTAPGLTARDEAETEVKKLVAELWGDLDGRTVTQRSHGKGQVLWDTPSPATLKRLRIDPDFEYIAGSENPTVRYFHRSIGEADVYFVANRAKRDESVVCTFRTAGKQPEIWNPETGEIAAAAVYDTANGRTRLPLRLAPAGSVFVVFRRASVSAPFISVQRGSESLLDVASVGAAWQAPAPLEIRFNREGKGEALIWENGDYRFATARGDFALNVVNECGTTPVEGPWKVKFPAGLGAPTEMQLGVLGSLAQHAEFGVRHFSGTMTYEKSFRYDGPRGASQAAFLDLGRVEIIAEVNLNGQELGLLWKPPFRVEISRALRPGENVLSVRVTNLWPNRLIGDEYYPPEDDYTPLGAIKKLPEWYVQDRPRPGPRIAFATWKHYTKEDALLESGLLGPVTLLTASRKNIE